MSWLWAAIAAQVILGTSAVFDKWLLKRNFFDPLSYTFWFVVLSLWVILLIPFGFEPVSFKVFLLAFSAEGTFILAIYFLFYALSRGEASKIYPLEGGLTSLAALAAGYFFLNSTLASADFVGFALLLVGSAILFVIEEKELRVSIALIILAASVFFGISHVLSKAVFNQTAFLNGYIWIKLTAIFFIFIPLAFKGFRQRIFNAKTAGISSRNKIFYFGNRAYAALGSILIYWAISLTHPALVDATQSFKYVVIFLVAWLFLAEHFKGKMLFGKLAATALVSVGLIWLGLNAYARNIPVDNNRPIIWGLTFSQKYSRLLGLDWQKNYEDILTDLQPKKVRLVAYWDEIEKTAGVYDFSELDWLIERSNRAGVKVVLAMGMKAPRWPECHNPAWTDNLPPEARETLVKNYVAATVKQYRNNPAVELWQVENEPYLNFGLCGQRPENFLSDEISLVKSLDSRPILTTDSGEFGAWRKAAKDGDIFGTTMYRKVYSPTIGKYIGIIEYPLDPSFFKIKERIVRRLLGEWEKKFLVIELQAEPWGRVESHLLPYEEQISIFSPEYFADTIEYARATGFDEYYLWGVEWWYKLKEQNNDERYWEYAKEIINKK